MRRVHSASFWSLHDWRKGKSDEDDAVGGVGHRMHSHLLTPDDGGDLGSVRDGRWVQLYKTVLYKAVDLETRGENKEIPMVD
jgi:hypothetical protein